MDILIRSVCFTWRIAESDTLGLVYRSNFNHNFLMVLETPNLVGTYQSLKRASFVDIIIEDFVHFKILIISFWFMGVDNKLFDCGKHPKGS